MQKLSEFTLVLVIFFGVIEASAAEDLSISISKLGNQSEAIGAMRALTDAGVEAFPLLLEHLKDGETVRNHAVTRDVTDAPTVGELCFEILQTEIEDGWPKAFRQYYVLTPRNVKQWLAKRKELSLDELRLASRAEALHRVEVALEAHPKNETLVSAENFLYAQVLMLQHSREVRRNRGL